MDSFGAAHRSPLRIVLTGSESVGKTTLAAQLATHFGVLVVPEFVREYASNKGAPLDFSDHGPIARGQIALEDAAIAEATRRDDPLLFHDTDLLSTVVYCHHYFGRCPPFIEDLAIARMPSQYLLLDIDMPWVPDGVRDRSDHRDEVQSLFRTTLQRFNAPFTTIVGDWDERFRAARDVVIETLPSAPP